MPTASTVPLLILIAFLWYYTKGHILSIVLFTSIFEAASAINIGALGVSPPLFALGVCLAVKALQGHRPTRFIAGINKTALHLLIFFIGYAVFTGMAYPFLFQGTPVMHDAATTPLAWGMSNFAQISYLLASVLLFFMTLSSSRQELGQAIDWYVRGCITMALIAMYQLANAIIHVPYPEAVLYSNPSHVIYRAYMINGIWRLNSTCSEASELASLMIVGIGLLGWIIMTRPLRIWRCICLLLMVISLLLTESSLGYLCLGFTLAVGGALYSKYSFGKRGISQAKLAVMVILVTGIVALFTLNKNAGQTVDKLVTSILLDKKNSQSYRERTQTHVAALETASQTYYMGAGWGSVRASGLPYVLMGNVGVVGTLLFFVFYGSLFIPFFSRRWVTTHQAGNDVFEQSLFGTTIMLVGLSVAGAEPVQPILWILFGVATAARPGKALTRSLEPDHRIFSPGKRYNQLSPEFRNS